MNFCFVTTRRGSFFMTELLSAVAAAAESVGHTAELVFDAFPPRSQGWTYIVVPHEFHAWGDPCGFPDRDQRARTVALCTENPGTEWFEATYRLLPELAAAVSINRSSAAELRRRGIRCEHVQLGYVPQWDSWRHDDSRQRPIDMLYLGAADPRRDPLLGRIGTDLWARRCELLIPPLEPRTTPRPDFLTGTDKYHRLRAAKVLLNLHRTTSAALEWMRFLEAICNGCVVVSEPCLDPEPLAAGEHFLACDADRIGKAVDALLDDPERLGAIRERAYEFVRDELPMSAVVERLAELADELPCTPADGVLFRPEPHSAPATSRTTAPASATSFTSTPTARGSRRPRRLIARMAPASPLAAIAGARAKRRAAREVLATTPAYDRATPRVSAIGVIRDDAERRSLELLESVARSATDALELIVLDESRSGRDDRAAARFLDAHPALPILMLGTDVSEPSAQRNLLVAHARAEFLLVLNRGGGIFPSTVERLASALDEDDRAFFAYPMIAVCDGRSAVDLRGSLPWEPERLARGNWIDTPALIRRERLLELGGYATDPRLRGIEDFDLWCRCADADGHGVHVPQVLAWHARIDTAQPLDLVALPPATRQVLCERSPRLLAGVAHT